MEQEGRAQSEVIGVILLTAVVAILVLSAGAVLIPSFIDDSERHNVAISVTATTQNVTLTHTGGDTVESADVTVFLRGDETEQYPLVDFWQERGTDVTAFERGDRWTRTHSIPGDRMEVLVVHVPSNRVLEQKTVEIEETIAARFEFEPENPFVSDTIEFDASDSVYFEGEITDYDWDFDDGNTDSGEQVTHSYDDTGEYDVTLSIETDDGRSADRTQTVEVTAEPEPGSFSGEVQDDDDNPVTQEVTFERPGGSVLGTATPDEEDGSYHIDDVDPGTYDITASADGFEDDTVTGVEIDEGEETEDVNFTLSTGDPPSVETEDSRDVGPFSATLEGDLTDLGDASDVFVYFEYREEGASEWEETDGQEVSETGEFEEEVTGLEPNTEYEFRAVAESNLGSDTGETLFFETDRGPPSFDTISATVTEYQQGQDAIQGISVEGSVNNVDIDGSIEIEFTGETEEIEPQENTDRQIGMEDTFEENFETGSGNAGPGELGVILTLLDGDGNPYETCESEDDGLSEGDSEITLDGDGFYCS